MGTVLMGTEGVEVHGSGSECSFDTLETGGGSKEDNETRDGSKDESKDDTSCTSEEWRAQVTWLDIDKARRGIRSAQGSRSVAVWSSTGPSRMRSSPVKFEHPLPDLKQLTSQHGLSLHSALNNQGQLKELLKRRATNDPNVHDSDGDRTPLHWPRRCTGTQKPAPPHSLHRSLRLLCTHKLAPPHSLHRSLRLLCGHGTLAHFLYPPSARIARVRAASVASEVLATGSVNMWSGDKRRGRGRVRAQRGSRGVHLRETGRRRAAHLL